MWNVYNRNIPNGYLGYDSRYQELYNEVPYYHYFDGMPGPSAPWREFQTIDGRTVLLIRTQEGLWYRFPEGNNAIGYGGDQPVIVGTASEGSSGSRPVNVGGSSGGRQQDIRDFAGTQDVNRMSQGQIDSQLNRSHSVLSDALRLTYAQNYRIGQLANRLTRIPGAGLIAHHIYGIAQWSGVAAGVIDIAGLAQDLYRGNYGQAAHHLTNLVVEYGPRMFGIPINGNTAALIASACVRSVAFLEELTRPEEGGTDADQPPGQDL